MIGHILAQVGIKSCSTNVRSQFDFPFMLVVTSDNSQHFINEHDIMYVRAEGAYCWLILFDRDDLLISQNLNSLYKQLNNKDLIRIHRSSIVNIRFAKKIDSNIITMKDSETLQISSNYRKDLISKFTIL